MLSHSCQSYHIACQIIWFTALSPYLVMAVLLGRALTLEGAGYGLLYYVSPQWDYLWRGRTWIDGATQIFFAYSVGSGALPALGSYNKFYHNCVKDTVITCFVNSGKKNVINHTARFLFKSMRLCLFGGFSGREN